MIGKEVYIKTIIQNFQSHIRLVIGQTATHAETFVISLLTVSFIGEKIDPSTNVEITDTTGVGEVETFVNRIPYSIQETATQNRFYCIFIIFPEILIAPLVFIILCITVDAYVCAEPCLGR